MEKETHGNCANIWRETSECRTLSHKRCRTAENVAFNAWKASEVLASNLSMIYKLMWYNMVIYIDYDGCPRSMCVIDRCDTETGAVDVGALTTPGICRKLSNPKNILYVQKRSHHHPTITKLLQCA